MHRAGGCHIPPDGKSCPYAGHFTPGVAVAAAAGMGRGNGSFLIISSLVPRVGIDCVHLCRR